MDRASNKDGHFGLIGMRERAASIGGTLDIASEVGAGTSVTLRVPLEATR
jgi:signal transduction histidine kinase